MGAAREDGLASACAPVGEPDNDRMSNAGAQSLVTPAALAAYVHDVVDHFQPKQVILFGSLARGHGRWDSDADLLVVMPFEGTHRQQIRAIRRTCHASFPLDLLVRRPDEVSARYAGGDPIIREALDHGQVLHG